MILATDLVKKYEEHCEVKTFSDLIEQVSNLNREILVGEIDQEFAESIEMLIRYWNNVDMDIPIENRLPIKIFINSPGGNLSGCFTIIDSIKMSKTPVYTIAVGEVYSAGFFIFLNGHKRMSYPNASFLFHEGAASSGQMDANRFQNFASFYKRQINRLKEITLTNSKITEEWYKEHQNDDHWMFAEEAIELGIVDEIITDFV